MICVECATQIGPSLLACPNCNRLVHADRLKGLAAEAVRARGNHDASAEIAAWRSALDLLPDASSQHKTIQARVDELGAALIDNRSAAPAHSDSVALTSHAAAAAPANNDFVTLTGNAAAPAGIARAGIAPAARPAAALTAHALTPNAPAASGQGDGEGRRADSGRWNLKTGGALSGLGLLAWKFKAIVVLLLTKGKLLLLGLTNSTTLLSIIPALGVYWVMFGWRLAAGLIASIYVHEMGHVFALSRFGIPASAPMFLPGLGAVIRSRFHRINPREEARVGIAGPIWGLGAAAAAFAMYAATGYPIWLAIGHLGAWINLFNLLPVWQLDGARAFRALNRGERWFITLVIVAAFLLTREGLLVLLAILSGIQAARPADWPDGDRPITVQFAALVIALAVMCTTRLPSVAG